MSYGISRGKQFLSVLAECGYAIREDARVLDFGCGAGTLVAEFRNAGFDAFGCDFAFKDGPHVPRLRESGHIRLINADEYRLPFDDHVFDIVVSDEVFEHVSDYGSALREIGRVLRSDGVSVHFFPSRYVPIEPHVKVPCATILQNESWLRFWAMLGIRNEYQKNLSARTVASANCRYLRRSTNYLPKAKILDEFSQAFGKVEFAERAFLKFSRRARFAYSMSLWLPFVARMYGACWSRVVVAAEPFRT